MRSKHKKVKAFFAFNIFLLSILFYSPKHPDFLTKNDILKSTWEILTYESIDECNLLHTSHLHNTFACSPLSKCKYRKKDSFFKLLLLLFGNITLSPWPSDMDQPSNYSKWNIFKAPEYHYIRYSINGLFP